MSVTKALIHSKPIATSPPLQMQDGATVVIVSYNTRALVLRCLETLLAAAHQVALQVVVVDNGSTDGTSAAIGTLFADKVTVLQLTCNEGFAQAANRGANMAIYPWLVFLNSDTELLPETAPIDLLISTALANPKAGIVGGATCFADGRPNPTACFQRPSIWSLICRGMGFTALWPRSPWFDPEYVPLPTVPTENTAPMSVDIVTGCFLLISRNLWTSANGFDPRFWMYGEDADLCLRLRAREYHALCVPQAIVVHHGGGSANSATSQKQQLLRAQATLIRTHWRAPAVACALTVMWTSAALRYAGLSGLAKFWPLLRPRADMARTIWANRRKWIKQDSGCGTFDR